jgi:hypothetical protein
MPMMKLSSKKTKAKNMMQLSEETTVSRSRHPGVHVQNLARQQGRSSPFGWKLFSTSLPMSELTPMGLSSKVVARDDRHKVEETQQQMRQSDPKRLVKQGSSLFGREVGGVVLVLEFDDQAELFQERQEVLEADVVDQEEEVDDGLGSGRATDPVNVHVVVDFVAQNGHRRQPAAR